MSGVRRITRERIPEDVHPTNIEKKGNYAVAIVWSDGHRSSIYPYEVLMGNKIPGRSEPI